MYLSCTRPSIFLLFTYKIWKSRNVLNTIFLLSYEYDS